jgi:hypothetical protein
MKLSEILRLATATPKTLVFHQPSAQTLRCLTGVNALYNSDAGGYLLSVEEPPQKKGTALIYRLSNKGRFSWVSVHQVQKDWQIDAFG